MIPRNENFSQSLSSSKHIILSVVTYKLYLQQKKKNHKENFEYENQDSTC